MVFGMDSGYQLYASSVQLESDRVASSVVRHISVATEHLTAEKQPILPNVWQTRRTAGEREPTGFRYGKS